MLGTFSSFSDIGIPVDRDIGTSDFSSCLRLSEEKMRCVYYKGINTETHHNFLAQDGIVHLKKWSKNSFNLEPFLEMKWCHFGGWICFFLGKKTAPPSKVAHFYYLMQPINIIKQGFSLLGQLFFNSAHMHNATVQVLTLITHPPHTCIVLNDRNTW